MADRLAAMRSNWNKFAVTFTETANKRMTLQCAQQLHANMQLEHATAVLEVAAGAGLGSLDVARYLSESAASGSPKSLTVTDFSPVMVGLARENLKATASGRLRVQCVEANALDLAEIPSSSMDRYISSLTLQLVPDADAMLREAHRVLRPDGLAGFTIWGQPEHSGMFTINAAANAELGLEQTGEHSNFVLGSDLEVLRERFFRAGFSQVRIWPFLCVVERWSGREFAQFHQQTFPLEDQVVRAQRFRVVERMADEWLAAKGFPIGLETYLVLAKR